MTAAILSLPPIADAFALARMVIDRDGTTVDDIRDAATVLEHSSFPADIIRVRAARHALCAHDVSDLVGLARDIRRRVTLRAIDQSHLGRMAEHYEAMSDARDAEVRYRRGARVIATIAMIGATLAVLAHVAIAAPAKTARTLALVEEAR